MSDTERIEVVIEWNKGEQAPPMTLSVHEDHLVTLFQAAAVTINCANGDRVRFVRDKAADREGSDG